MKLCSVCLQSDILCSACSKKVEEGKIKRIDVTLSRALNRINREKDYKLDFLETVEDGGKLFIIVETPYVARFIGPGGRNIRQLSQEISRQVKLLEKVEGSERHVIEKLIDSPVIGINKVYSGTESYKVRVDTKYAKNVRPLSDVVSKIIGKKVSFIFE